MDENVLKEFVKIMRDFLIDIKTTFVECENIIYKNKGLNAILNNDIKNESIKEIINYCLKLYPERFFDILYKNEEIFNDNEKNCEFIPNIDFKVLWKQNISDNTKKIIWKYLQLILFGVSKMVDGADSFGDAAKLFEAINENELLEKLEETIGNMTNMFDLSNNINFENEINMELSGVNLPNPNEIHSHLRGLLEGNLGRLAHEIAEETAQELEYDMSSATTISDVFQNLFKNPNKLVNMVKKVGNKLDEKLKSGEIKESELMKEASELMEKMGDIPGMKNMEKVFKNMGIPIGKNSKINMKSMQSNMQRNIRQSTQKERMLEKLKKRREKRSLDEQLEQLKQAQAHAHAQAQAHAHAHAQAHAQAHANKNFNHMTYVTETGEKIEKSARKKKKKKKNRKKKNIKK